MPFFGKSGTPRMSCLNLSIPNLTMLQFLRARKRGLLSRKSGHIIAAPAGKHQTKSIPVSFEIVARVAQRQQSAILGALWNRKRSCEAAVCLRPTVGIANARLRYPL